MPVYGQYRVLCAGDCGGWLVEGRPLIGHRIADSYSTVLAARKGAIRAGWGKDQKCPSCREKEGENADERPV